jgi:hypothetical protein
MGAANLASKRAIRATRSRPLERARALLNWRLDVATITQLSHYFNEANYVGTNPPITRLTEVN